MREHLAEERFRRILDTAPDAMVVVGPDALIAFVNLQTEKLFGYPRSVLLGRPLDMLIPERFRAGHGGHLARYFASPGARPMGSGIELFGRRADGTEMSIEVSLSPVETGDGMLVAAAIRDITERKRIEAVAKLNAGRLASAIESIQGAFALYDACDKLVLCNSAYRGIMGQDATGILTGKPFDEILNAWVGGLAFADDDERDCFRADRIEERNHPKGPFDVRTRDGRSLRVANRLTIEGGIVQTIWDLTNDVQREGELHEARAAAEAASAAKSEFLSSMSHELRTPLNAIIGFAELLTRDKQQPLTDRHRQRVDHILKGGEHLLCLIDDILDLARIEAGGVSISPEPVSVVDVLEEVRATLEPIAVSAGLHLEIAAPLADSPIVRADRRRFVQILMNYASNAIKYNRPGGSVTFTVAHPTAEHVRITVTDTGMGIPAAKQSTLFQPFQRAGQETGPIEGTGIGLVISKRLADLMAGNVGFRSVAGQGSAFWVDIPRHPAHAHPTKTMKVGDEEAAPEALLALKG